MKTLKPIPLMSSTNNFLPDEYFYLSPDLENWQLTEINLAIQEADKKDFIKLLKKYSV